MTVFRTRMGADGQRVALLEGKSQPVPTEPAPPREPGVLLLAAPVIFGKANPVKHFSKKVKAWDPDKHPKGWKGLFIDTPDKSKAKDAKPGDVITTKSGKAFVVEKPMGKGLKVNPIDQVTGEQKGGYTVLGFDIDVAVVESAKAPGTSHTIGSLEPGTVIKTKNGKRFKVSKHGKPSTSKTGQIKAYTTVYPIDDKGEVIGKHTVLPQDHLVTIDAPEVKSGVTPADVKKIDEVIAEAEKAIGTPEGTIAQPKPEAGDGPPKTGDTVGVDKLEPGMTVQGKSGNQYDVWSVDGKIGIAPVGKDVTGPDDPNFSVEPGPTSQWKIDHLPSVDEKYAFHIGAVKTFDAPGASPGAPVAGQKSLHEYHKSPEGLAQLFVDHEFETTGYENALSDVMDALEAIDGTSDEGVDGLPKTGVAFANVYAPMWGPGDKEDLATAYDAWHGKTPAAADPSSHKALVGKLFTENTGAFDGPVQVMHYSPDHSPTEGGLFNLSFASDPTGDWFDVPADDFYANFTPLPGQESGKGPAASTGEVTVLDPDPKTIAYILSDELGLGDPDNVADFLVQQPPITSAAELESAWYQIVTDTFEGEVPDEDLASMLPSPGYVSMVWEANQIEVLDGEPSNLQIAQQALAQAVKDLSSQAPVIKAMEALDDWKDYQAHLENLDPEDPFAHLKALSKMGETTLWKTVDAAHPKGLLHLEQEKLALAKAQYAQQVAAAQPQLQSPLLPTQPKPEEILPEKLPKVPKAYAPGVGAKTSVRIAEYNGIHVVERVTATGETVQRFGTHHAKTAAIKQARAESADHEAIVMESTTLNMPAMRTDMGKAGAIEKGDYLAVDYGLVGRVEEVKEVQAPQTSWQKAAGLAPQIRRLYTIDIGGEPRTMMIVGNPDSDGNLSGATQNFTWAKIPGGVDEVNEFFEAQGGVVDRASVQAWFAQSEWAKKQQDSVRAARPGKYTPYLQHDWSADDELIGKTVNEALKVTNKLGYREIKPRLKDQVRLVRADGSRLFLDRDGNQITGVHKPDVGVIHVDGSARDVYDQLAETLATGGDVSALDPLASSAPATAKTSHVRRMVYDLALGKQNKVDVAIGKSAANVKVKTDVEYAAELEKEGAAPTLEQAKAAVERPPYTIANPRTNSLRQFFDDDTPEGEAAIDKYAAEGFKTEEPLDEWEAAALSAVMKRQGVARLVGQQGDPLHEGDFRPELKAKDPVDGARKLAKAWSAYNDAQKAATADLNAETAAAVKATTIGQMSDQTRVYLEAEMNKWRVLADQAREAREAEWLGRAANWRTAQIQDEITKRRTAEGTVPEPPSAASAFDMPVWDEIEFEPQTYADINLLASQRGATPHDVPAFYTGGVFQDGVLYHRTDWTSGEVPLELDAEVVQRLEQLGAIQEANRDPIAPGVVGSYEHYDGVQLTLNESSALGAGSLFQDGSGLHWKILSVEPDGTYTVQESDASGVAAGEVVSGATMAQMGQAATSAKRIEYVPHTQAASNAGGAPTSQRGVLRLVGYTPEEAAARLREIGLLGDLEPEVPFKAILRGPRRYGHLAPLHPAYIRGEEPPPEPKYHVTHGLTASGTKGMEGLKAILDSGGLMSIAERHRQGILLNTKGASVSGDIRSGIDHAVFCTTDGSGCVGAGSSVRFVMKPSAYMRRDVVLASQDFGGCETRYNKYKQELNALQAEVGVPKTNLYEPVHPKVRQRWMDKHSGAYSEEFNIGPTIAIEDVEAIGVQTQQQVEETNAYLDALIAKGRIASKPKIMLTAQAQKLADSKPGLAKAPAKPGSKPPGAKGMYQEKLTDLDVDDEVWAQNQAGTWAKVTVTSKAASISGVVKAKTAFDTTLEIKDADIVAGKVWY